MANQSEADRRMITIGQVAAYAGVTIKAVRHYHERGLLEAPPRDASGYRRYSAGHAITLIKIKTLADAGVPLARVKELLAAEPKRFRDAMKEIDRTLQAKADEIQQTRKRIAQLGAGDRLFVSIAVADYLDKLVAIGVSRRQVQMERDGWILMQSVSPKQAAAWIAEKRKLLKDPEFRAFYVAYDAAFDWSPDDRRLHALARRAERWLAEHSRKDKSRSSEIQDRAVVQLLAKSPGVSSPAWDRLREISFAVKSRAPRAR